MEVVARGVKLKKAGADYVACCPFHDEKTPSFTVSPSKQFYHCFGCGAHGTSISFIMEHEGLNFRETIEVLANRAGMEVPEQARHAKASRGTAEISEVLATAATFYRKQLKQSQSAISYLKSRGVTGEAAARFGLGYAPDGWQNLAAAFSDYHHRSLLQAGLVVDEGRRYDRFRDRIMFPIFDHRGQVIGFGGRSLGSSEPKYLNSPESPLFEKGRELYGLFHARRSRQAKSQLIVVEGYMDVLMLAQHGIENVVATLGTATTVHHAEKLLRQAEELIFCFDGDEAGKRAAWRALEVMLPQLRDGKQVAFSFLPAQHDPDSFVRESGPDEFSARMREALPLSEFLIRELALRFNMQSGEGKSAFLNAAKPLVLNVKAPLYSLMLRTRLAQAAQIVRVELDRLYGIKSPPKRIGRPLMRQSPPSLERRLLQCVLAKPSLNPHVTGDSFTGPEADFLRETLEFLRACPQVTATAGLIEYFSRSPHARLLQEIEVEVAEIFDNEFDVDRQFEEVTAKLRAIHRKNLRDAALLKMEQAGNSNLEDAKAEYRELASRAANREQI